MQSRFRHRRFLTTMIPVALVAALGLTGCATPAAAPAPSTFRGVGVELVVGTHANEPAPDLPASVLTQVAHAVDAEKPIGVIAVEGRPRVLQPPLPMSVTGETPAERAASNRRNTDAVAALVRDASPARAGADLLTSLLVAAKAADTAATPIPRIVVVDSGLSDRGPLDLTVRGMTGADPTDVARDLLRRRLLRSDTFAGLTVEFVGLGTSTAPPQRPLPAAQVANIADIYSAVVRAGGGLPLVTPLDRRGAAPRSAPAVGVVSTSGGTVTLGGTSALGDGSSIAFQPGTATFRDPPAARQLLTPLARWLAPGTPHRAVVVGTTSSEGTASRGSDLRLSLLRADAVKQLLIVLGADASRIEAEGKGYIGDPPDRVGGVLDPAKAAQNRVVRITTIR